MMRGENMSKFYSPHEIELKKVIKEMIEKGLDEKAILNIYLKNLKDVLDETINSNK